MISNFVLHYLINANKQILMLKRINTPFSNNCYSLPGGEIHKGETATQAILREAKNSIGLDLIKSDLEFAHTTYRKCNDPEFFTCVFKTAALNFVPKNLEINRHDDIKWFDLKDLPVNIVAAHQYVIEQIQQQKLYSEHGWGE